MVDPKTKPLQKKGLKKKYSMCYISILYWHYIKFLEMFFNLTPYERRGPRGGGWIQTFHMSWLKLLFKDENIDKKGEHDLNILFYNKPLILQFIFSWTKQKFLTFLYFSPAHIQTNVSYRYSKIYNSEHCRFWSLCLFVCVGFSVKLLMKNFLKNLWDS